MIREMGTSFFLENSMALVTIQEPKSLYVKPENEPSKFKIPGKNKEYHGIAFWGKDNKLPKELYKSIGANPITSSGAGFNHRVIFGGGVVVAKRDEKGQAHPNNRVHRD
jgi:hypothetical protein